MVGAGLSQRRDSYVPQLIVGGGSSNVRVGANAVVLGDHGAGGSERGRVGEEEVGEKKKDEVWRRANRSARAARDMVD